MHQSGTEAGLLLVVVLAPNTAHPHRFRRQTQRRLLPRKQRVAYVVCDCAIPGLCQTIERTKIQFARILVVGTRDQYFVCHSLLPRFGPLVMLTTREMST